MLHLFLVVPGCTDVCVCMLVALSHAPPLSTNRSQKEEWQAKGRGLKEGGGSGPGSQRRENDGTRTRVWFKIGDEFANVSERTIQHWRRLAEQEGREPQSRNPMVEVE